MARKELLNPNADGGRETERACQLRLLGCWRPSYSLPRASLHNCPGVSGGSVQCEELFKSLLSFKKKSLTFLDETWKNTLQSATMLARIFPTIEDAAESSHLYTHFEIRS